MSDTELIGTLAFELEDAKEMIAFLTGMRRMQADYIQKLSKRNNRLAKLLGVHPTVVPERMLAMNLPLRMEKTNGHH